MDHSPGFWLWPRILGTVYPRRNQGAKSTLLLSTPLRHNGPPRPVPGGPLMKFGPPSVKKVFFGIGVLCFGLLMLASDCGMLPYPPISAGLAQHLPQWSLDGSKIVFNYDAASIYTVASDGSSLTVVTKGKPYDEPKISPSISPDGSRVAYAHDEGRSGIPR